LAFPIASGGFRHDWINRKASLQQLIDGRTSAGFHRDRQAGPWRQGLLSLLPTCGSMFKSQFYYALTSGIDHDQVVVIVGPVQGRKVRQFLPWFHELQASGLLAGSPRLSRSNTTALLGQSSL